MRTVRIEPLTGCNQTRECMEPGCLNTTRESKPYCPDHVELNPYIQGILEKLEERKIEHNRVKEVGQDAVDLSGLTVNEILLHLELHGSRTVERLKREFQLEDSVLLPYFEKLERAGKITLGKTQRGSTVVRLKQRVA